MILDHHLIIMIIVIVAKHLNGTPATGSMSHMPVSLVPITHKGVES